MKKLLSLLSISTLTANVPAPLLANKSLERTKRDIDKITAPLIRNKREREETYELSLKKSKLTLKSSKDDNSEWNQKWEIKFNVENEFMSNNLPPRMKLNDWEFYVDKNDKITLPILKSLEYDLNWEKNNEPRYWENKDFLSYQNKKLKNIKIKVQEWDKNEKYAKWKILSFKAEKDNLDWVKQQSQFNLVDSTKKMTWTRSDLITVDDELNIAIANPNIDKVVFDNVLQPQTNKQWNINVKPENTPRDHRLQVSFTLDGKPYTSEITVSMQAKIDAPAPIIKENLSDVIKFGDENNLGNILDNNDNTIISAITQTNSRIIDFSQLEITNKESNQATLTAKPDSKSYAGSVEVTYNVIPATIVDLKIDLKPTSNQAIAVQDYVGQIDPSAITNPVQTFYFVNSESTITIKKPTISSVITGVVYACDEQWNKTVQATAIDATNGIKLDGSQLATSNGKYVVELSDNLGHTNNLYLQIAPKQAITNYFDTSNGKQFEIWSKANGHDDIRGVSARQINKLFEESKNWQHQANGSKNANSFEPKTANNNLPNNNKSGLTGWTVVGIIVGTLSGLLLLGWLLKKFIVTPLILEPIRKKKAKAFAEQTAKDIAQMKADEAEEEAKRKGEK